jgi:hypothetical protein
VSQKFTLALTLCRSCTYRQVLIELGPSYFKYMESTANNPTVLAKLLGFYTIEIRNVESGTVQAKADLLVMENLFFGKKIVKTFDLKGSKDVKSRLRHQELLPSHFSMVIGSKV